ncbi:lactonase family protein [Vibrio sp.]|nr:lactonase family protein [Vibrio sp.]
MLENKQSNKNLAYIGTYTPKSHGVYCFDVSEQGELTNKRLAAALENPAQLTHKNGQFLYVALEISQYQGKETGCILSFEIKSDGSLAKINEIDSFGSGPAYITLSQCQNYLLVANYAGGSTSVFELASDGRILSPTFLESHLGNAISCIPKLAPEGGFVECGHDASHAHMISSSPDNNFLIGTDLGLDRINLWSFDSVSGQAAPHNPSHIECDKGSGPRHFVFHPTIACIYLLSEQASTLTTYEYNSDFKLSKKHEISSLPEGYKGTSFASDIKISQDGKFLYALNRLHNSIAIFNIDEQGKATLMKVEWCRGDFPRGFTLSLCGKFCYVTCQNSDNVTIFERCDTSGLLNFTEKYIPVGSPSQLIVL